MKESTTVYWIKVSTTVYWMKESTTVYWICTFISINPQTLNRNKHQHRVMLFLVAMFSESFMVHWEQKKLLSMWHRMFIKAQRRALLWQGNAILNASTSKSIHVEDHVCHGYIHFPLQTNQDKCVHSVCDASENGVPSWCGVRQWCAWNQMGTSWACHHTFGLLEIVILASECILYEVEMDWVRQHSRSECSLTSNTSWKECVSDISDWLSLSVQKSDLF